MEADSNLVGTINDQSVTQVPISYRIIGLPGTGKTQKLLSMLTEFISVICGDDY